MKRPFADDRPFGPFAARDDGIVFKSVHTVDGLDNIDLDTLEDNLEDVLYDADNEVKDVDISSARGSNNVTVRVMYEGDSFSDSLENKMLNRMMRELEK